MGAGHVSPAHMEFTHLKKKLAIAIRGHRLLKDRRDELMRQFLGLVRESRVPREKVETGVVVANQNFVLIRSGVTDEALNVALMTPKQEVYPESEARNVTGVEIPVFKYKTRVSDPNDVYSYGFTPISSGLDDTIRSLTDLLPGMLRLVECEKSCQFMAAETGETRRRINTLERAMIPGTQQDIHYITVKLDKNERSSQIRLMKVKDMVLEKVHHYSERGVIPVVGGVRNRMGRPDHLCGRFMKPL